ncbi:DUF4743 domain-containing protein [Chitinibacter sp. S2-10]|uniref:NUDIX hydrolase n=1 Tax=Chitinibacter sp. S2-10 TaxID=3373597 RepID=UPI003977B8EE
MSSNSSQLIERYLASQPQFDTSALLRLIVNGQALGWLEMPVASVLNQFDSRFALQTNTVVVELENPQLQDLMNAAALHLRATGWIKVWRDELYAVHPPIENGQLDTTTTLFTLERGAFRRFGLCSKAVHINGISHNGDLWLARRSPTKGIDPDKLDNLAAGGIPQGESAAECVVRELAEEAGINQHIAQQAVYIEQIRSTRNEIDGTHDEILYCYDLQLPAEVIPHNTDGEVAAFHCVSMAECAARLPEMTWDAGLVTARLLTRLAST